MAEATTTRYQLDVNRDQLALITLGLSLLGTQLASEATTAATTFEAAQCRRSAAIAGELRAAMHAVLTRPHHPQPERQPS